MKTLTVAIPCYNSEAYMDKAIESILICRDDVEILIVDDGSKDRTAEIGDAYAEKYPDTIRCIHQENGGHGEAVNTGIKNATGRYFKVLDSDDWFDQTALIKVVTTLKSLEEDIDMMIVNYIYDKPSENRQHVIKYTNALPVDRVFSWYNVKHFRASQNLLMHSIIYNTETLRKSGLVLPKHTFYVDNLFVYEPLPYVEKMYYLNVDLYHYFIGRSDQSVNEGIMISRIDQQLAVNKRMITGVDVMGIKSRKLRQYMVKYLAMISTVSTCLLIKSGTEENIAKKDELWAFMKEQNPDLYKAVKRTFLGRAMGLNGTYGHKALVMGYKIAHKLYDFN
ncbi:MAG: glycosyltransferase family 2 protein [Erysipelotrichaceae bacterium]|nr:glycosyltransferase family 2 protein [Erysipelotrichaceae bacterium]